ncbi:hypothetical protein L195_g054589, partial [Trifolium pratense]
MNTAVEYAFHGLPRNADVDLTKEWSEFDLSATAWWTIGPAVFLKAISRAMNPLPLTPSEK